MHRAVFPPCCLTWGQTMVQVMKIMVISLKMSHACTAALSAPKPAAGHCWPTPLLETPGQVWVSLFWGLLLFSLWSWCTQGFVCALQESVFPVLCWWLHGGVNGDLLQEGLCHTQVYWTQSPCPCSSPLLAHTSTGDTQTQFLLSFCGVSGSWCTQGLFEHSKHLWHVWGLILNAISSLLPSFWGFSFAFGCGVSFFGGIQHSPVNGCSAVSCNFGVLSGEVERKSFYSTILKYILKEISPEYYWKD